MTTRAAVERIGLCRDAASAEQPGWQLTTQVEARQSTKPLDGVMQACPQVPQLAASLVVSAQ
jgi:hypothetical protein